jgi:amino acid transporter
MGSAFFFGLTCPANSADLINGGSRALKSPMTIAIQNAGWQGGVHLVSRDVSIRGRDLSLTPRRSMLSFSSLA